MSYAITPSEVLDGFNTGASASDITAYITVVDQADSCLTSHSVSVDIGKRLKILGVRHLVSMASDNGAVAEEEAVSGARRRYFSRPGSETGNMIALRSIDKFGCVLRVLNNNARVQLRSIGGRGPEITHG